MRFGLSVAVQLDLWSCLRVRSESTFTGEYSQRVVNSPPNGRSESGERRIFTGNGRETR